MKYFAISDIQWNEVLNSNWTITIVGGLVVLIIFALITYLFNKVMRKQTKLENELVTQTERSTARELSVITTSTQELKPKKPISHSYGYRLVEKMDKEPPYLREDAENAYVDQEIQLLVEFDSLRKVTEKDNVVYLYLVCKEGFPWVYGEVSLITYPWLKTLNSGKKLNVSGVVTKFKGQEIELKNMTIDLVS